MPTLLLRLAGPMQSWGTRSRFNERETERFPSKSGVIGLLCAARGISRDAPPERLAELTALRMGVRVDQPGTLQVDYHTATPVERRSASGRQRKEEAGAGALTRRYYLADAVFLVGLEGPEELLRSLDAALRAPVWPLALGRHAFPPAPPVWLPDGLRDEPLEAALRGYPWLLGRPEASNRSRKLPPRSDTLSGEIECLPGEEGEVRQDVPLSFDWERRAFTIRRVRAIDFPFPAAGNETPPEKRDVPE